MYVIAVDKLDKNKSIGELFRILEVSVMKVSFHKKRWGSGFNSIFLNFLMRIL